MSEIRYKTKERKDGNFLRKDEKGKKEIDVFHIPFLLILAKLGYSWVSPKIFEILRVMLWPNTDWRQHIGQVR